MAPPTDDAPAQRRLLTRQDVATQLHVSPRTVQRLKDSGQLKSIRVGGSVRFHPDDVAAYIDAQRQ